MATATKKGKKKSWSYSAGERGRNRVRAYEDDKTGLLFLEFYEAAPGQTTPKRKRVALGHRDCDKAKQQADKMAVDLATSAPPVTEDMTLQRLFDIYLVEVTPQKGESKRKHDIRCAEMFVRFFGKAREASTLNRRDWDRFIHQRRRGAIKPQGNAKGAHMATRKSPKTIGNRQIAYDLQFLTGVLNWATMAGDGKGNPLLERNPLKGLPLPREDSPVRPVLADGRYERMLEVAPRVDWRFELALVMAHETGHRIGAIRLLRWSDVDLDHGRIRWRGENDKIGNDHVTILTQEAVAALARARHEHPSIGDAWVFPAPGAPSEPCSRHLMRDWWNRAEENAGLPKVERLGWHSLRRKFATDLKTTPLKDLCHLGGWKNPQTILMCYQKPDEDTMRKALEGRRRLRAS
jgi:integrase